MIIVVVLVCFKVRKYIPIVYKPLVWYYLYKEQAQRISSNFAYKLELVIDTYG